MNGSQNTILLKQVQSLKNKREFERFITKSTDSLVSLRLFHLLTFFLSA